MNYAKIYERIIERALCRNIVGYTEKHHIVPRCLGGTNDKDNLVLLTAKEHFICHLLLTKMYLYGSNEYYKMCHAFLMMLVYGKSHQRYITSRKYEYLKKEASGLMSRLQSGNGNSQYDTVWIHNKVLKKCKKAKKNSIIEDGWELGRILDWNRNRFNVCIICKCNCRNDRAIYCSAECKNSNKPKHKFSGRENEFLELYLKYKTIDKSLRIMGGKGAGSDYNWAKTVMTNYNDNAVLEVYRKI